MSKKRLAELEEDATLLRFLSRIEYGVECITSTWLTSPLCITLFSTESDVLATFSLFLYWSGCKVWYTCFVWIALAIWSESDCGVVPDDAKKGYNCYT